jgi:hypothetical protein
VRLRGPITAVLVLLALAAGCGNDGGSTGTTTTTTGTVPEVIEPAGPVYARSPGARDALEAFIQAAGRRDCPAMFDLLTTASQLRWGPTQQGFCRATGRSLMNAVGEFVRLGKYEPVLDAKVSDVWSTAAIAGYIQRGEDRRYGGYALPARIEDGEWKLEVGGTVTFTPLTPDPDLKANSKPNISAEVAAAEPMLGSAVWVEGKSVQAVLSPDEGFLSSQIETPLAPGRHSAVVFGETESSAGALIWVFQVQ